MPSSVRDVKNASAALRGDTVVARTVTHVTGISPLARSGNGLGCAITVLTLVASAILAGVGLLLPPFSLGDRLFGTPFVTLNQHSPDASHDSLTVSVTGSAADVDVRITGISQGDFFYPPGPDDARMRRARTALPSSLSPVTAVYLLEGRGPPPSDPVRLSLAVPEGVAPDQVDMYGYAAEARRWYFLPTHRTDQPALVAETPALPDAVALFRVAPLVPVVSAVLEPGQALMPEVAGVVNVIHPAGLRPIPSGALEGALPAFSFGQHYAVIPVIRNFENPDQPDVQTISGLLQNAERTADHVQRLVEFMVSQPYRGLVIDYRGLTPDLRAPFTAFVAALADELRRANGTLTVVLPFPAADGEGYDTGGYDWRQLGALADCVQLLLPVDPQQFADGGAVSRLLHWATSQISRVKLQVALSLSTLAQQGDSFEPIPLAAALAPLGQLAVKPTGVIQPGTAVEVGFSGERLEVELTDAHNTPLVRYFSPDDVLTHAVWLLTPAALRARLGHVLVNNLAGVVMPNASAPGTVPGALQAVADYRLHGAKRAWAVPIEMLTVRWTVTADGALLDAHSGMLGIPFIYTPDGTASSLEISAELVSLQVKLGSVVVQVAAQEPAQPGRP